MSLPAYDVDQKQIPLENKPLTREEMKTFCISALGGGLDFYDFVVYVYFATIMSKLFFQTESPTTGLLLTYSVFACGYLARMCGGLLFSHLGDKSGRKKTSTYTIFLMAAATFTIGILPTYSQIGITASILLFFCRFAQGLAIGGGIPCSITFIYEHAHKSHRGFACAVLFCGINLGIFLGSSVGYVMTHFVSEDILYSWGWRIPFLVGGGLGIISVYLRRFLSETPVFKLMQKENTQPPISLLFKSHKFPLFQTASAALADAIAISFFFLYMPSYLSTYHGFKYHEVLKINSIAILIYALLIIFFGIVCDRVGARKVLNYGCLALIIFSLPIFSSFSENNFAAVYFCYITVSIAISALSAATILLLADSFPAEVRYSGSSFSYNLAFGVIGGFTPLIATSLIEYSGSNISPAYYIIFIAIIGLVSGMVKNKNIQQPCS